MASYTILTVFENADTINEPVIALPMMGKMSFRQIGIIVGLAVMLPMMIYSAGSEFLLGVFPDPVMELGVSAGTVKITADVIVSLIPVPFGILLGMPRPKLLTMDELLVVLVRFMLHHTSIKSVQEKKKNVPHKKSKLAGFGEKPELGLHKKAAPKNTFDIAVTDLGLPKNLTITLYDLKGNPMRNKLARTYIDDIMTGSITADSDGVIGMTFVPKSEGKKNLKILVDGIDGPVVDAILHIKRHG